MRLAVQYFQQYRLTPLSSSKMWLNVYRSLYRRLSGAVDRARCSLRLSSLRYSLLRLHTMAAAVAAPAGCPRRVATIEAPLSHLDPCPKCRVGFLLAPIICEGTQHPEHKDWWYRLVCTSSISYPSLSPLLLPTQVLPQCSAVLHPLYLLQLVSRSVDQHPFFVLPGSFTFPS